ncbi:MAG: DUF4388 domain-containing protein [Chloroflexi bacterium]|nr:DUF4388 domain-containing protein [Chloroflexota bacterium]
MAIQGHLGEMGLATLIQLTCQEATQARLTLRRDDQEAVLYFDRGNIVHALSADQEGKEVVYRVLTWKDGEFRLEMGIPPPARTIETPWSALLMEGLHRQDEERWETLDAEQIQREEEFAMPENMNDILKELSGQVPGFIAAAVVGMDGLDIAEYAAGPVDVESINAQMTLLFKLVDGAVDKLKAGVIEDYLLTTEKAYLLIRPLSDRNYYLGIVADRKSGNVGNMRLNSRIYAERLSKAMPK